MKTWIEGIDSYLNSLQLWMGNIKVGSFILG